MKGQKTVYVCTNCDYQSAGWLGRCPSCGCWNSFEEEKYEKETPTETKSVKRRSVTSNAAVKITELELPNYIRSKTGIGEFDRVLGGGLVNGSVVLFSGEPGIGKSTLLLQICKSLAKSSTVLYVSGEESCGQLKLRAQRLKVTSENLYILTETNVEDIMEWADKISPDIIIVDSIQTLYTERSSSIPGSVTQVKESSMQFIAKAKTEGISVLIVGHVNKEGGIAGPKVLEHMVDAVICFEGEKQNSYRILRAVKNRYGSTNEIGVFEMQDTGLCEVPNPSETLLEGRPKDVPGNCPVCVMEGTRPIIAEIQALVTITPSAKVPPRRTSNGVDYNRACLVLAVLEKRLGYKFRQYDAYINVVGGLMIDEPAQDLALTLALVSSLKNVPLPDDMLAVGEIGLSGECRGITHPELRIKEAERLGFKKIMLPKKSCKKLIKIPKDIELIPVNNIFEAMRIFDGKKSQTTYESEENVFEEYEREEF